jgi:hypothetical protein
MAGPAPALPPSLSGDVVRGRLLVVTIEFGVFLAKAV